MPTINRKPSSKPRNDALDIQRRQQDYNNKEWRKLSNYKRKCNPLCEVCLMLDKITPAEDVHHLDSFTKYEGAERIAKLLDFSNIISLCKSCHHEIHHGNLKGAKSIEEIRQYLIAQGKIKQ